MLNEERSFMPSATINIAVPENMKAEVEEVIAVDGYNNTSEFFRDMFRQYKQTRAQRKLEALLLEGLESGPVTPWTKEDLEAIRDRAFKRIEEKVRNKSK